MRFIFKTDYNQDIQLAKHGGHVFWYSLLGLFLLVVNAAMLGLVAWLLDGLRVDGLVAGVLGSIIVGVVSWAGQVMIGDGAGREVA